MLEHSTRQESEPKVSSSSYANPNYYQPSVLAKNEFDEKTWLLLPSCSNKECQLWSKGLPSPWEHQHEGALAKPGHKTSQGRAATPKIQLLT